MYKPLEDKKQLLKDKLSEIEHLTERHEVLKNIIQKKIDASRKLSQDIKDEESILEEKGSLP